MAKRRGTASTVWSGWKCVKKMRSTARGSSPERSMPRTAPEPRSKTIISPPARTTTQLWRLSRRGTTVPDPTTVISMFLPSVVTAFQHGAVGALSARFGPKGPRLSASQLGWLLFECPCEAGDAEQGAADDVRGPVCSEVDPARGGRGEEDQERDPGRSVGPQQVDGSKQEYRAQHVSAGVGVRCTQVEQRWVRRPHGILEDGRLGNHRFCCEFDEPCNEEGDDESCGETTASFRQ